jgi:hypothetical protein
MVTSAPENPTVCKLRTKATAGSTETYRPKYLSQRKMFRTEILGEKKLKYIFYAQEFV